MVNPRTTRLPEVLGRDEKVEPNTSEALAVDMVGTGKRVLALGSAGDLTLLLAAAGNRVTTVEAQAAATDEAPGAAESFVVGDLDGPGLGDLLTARTFDVVLLADVLEASRDVRRLLENARRFLVPGGYAVLNVPNLTHGSIRLGSPLDAPHRPLFTLKTLYEACFYAGFRLVEIARVKAPVFAAEGPAQIVKPSEIDREILRELEADPESDTLRFIVRAAPLGDEALARAERAAGGESAAALKARVEALTEQLRLAHERLTELDEAKRERDAAAAAFFAHVDAELARTRREIAHVDAMIRAVESSKWWTLKRAFGKARRVVANVLRRRPAG
jgi:SAM-dependent methyltransferase